MSSLTDRYPRPPAAAAPTVPHMSRREFLDMFGEEYGSGQHVSLLGPTQRGKTTLSHQMLAQVASPEHKAYVLSAKPPGRDPVMAKAGDRLNLRTVEEWPPSWSYKDRKNNGYIIRPKQTMTDHKADRINMHDVFSACMTDAYRTKSKRPVIIVADETHRLQNNLHLKDELEAPLMSGAPDCALWCLIQRSAYITYLAYCSPEWIILYYDPDAANQKRYGEIGGVDPKMVSAIVSRLQTKRGDDGKSTISEALCVRRSGPELFIISTD